MTSALRTAIHELDLDEAAWVAALHAEARPLLDDGHGLFAYTYRVEGGTIHLGALAGEDTAPEAWAALARWGAAHAPELASMYRTGVGSVAEARRAGLEPPLGEIVTVVGHDPSGFGVFLTAPSGRPTSPPIFERLAFELAASLRLRVHRQQRAHAKLSAAETSVANLLLEGASDKAIAAELDVSLSSVSTFLRRIRAKLGCRSGAELLMIGAGDVGARLVLFDRLSSAECDIASHLLVGATDLEIATIRGVSVRTIASQCAAIFRKCEVSGRRELASKLLSGNYG